jgi:hypothetical protein
MMHQTSRKTADAGYETRTRHPTDMGLDARQAVCEQGQSQGHNGDSNTDEAHEKWTEVGGRTKGGTQKPTDKHNNSNGVGTRSGGAYHSSDNHSIFVNRNGNRFEQDAARAPNMTTNTTMADGIEHYRVNVGYVDVCFMCGNGKGIFAFSL